MPMNYNDMSEEEQKKVRAAAMQCHFTCLFLFCTAAFACGLTATAFCAFVQRNPVVAFASLEEACNATGILEQDQCEPFLQNHGVGFYAWAATLKNQQPVCLSYTQYIPDVGYVTPTFDTKFNTAAASAIVADVFGALAFFTMAFASCCPMDAGRMKCLSFYFFIACLFQGLTLLIFRSSACAKGFFSVYFPELTANSGNDPIQSVSCSLSTGSKLAVAATVLYGWCMCSVPASNPPPPIGLSGEEAQEMEEGEAELETGGAEEGGGEKPVED